MKQSRKKAISDCNPSISPSVQSTPKELISNPIFTAIHSALKKFQEMQELPDIATLNEKLIIPGIHFIPDMADNYEPRIYLKGEVQTRNQSWHDFFNALVWQQFPKSKKMINQFQYTEQQKHYPTKHRTPVENMLTLFDENGAIIISQNPELLELIKQHRWHQLFWQYRDQVKSQLQVYIFGHGLYEKALNPYIGITAQSLLFSAPISTALDELISKFLQNNYPNLSTQHLHPLPILGIPGWWPENAQESFYANKSYFRDK